MGDEIYFNGVGIASCLDARTGTVRWVQRLPGNYSASPTFADGRIYFLSEEGEATVIAPGTEFRRLATNRLDGAMLASTAVSNILTPAAQRTALSRALRRHTLADSERHDSSTLLGGQPDATLPT